MVLRERREQRKFGNSSWVLGQAKFGAISRKYEIILEKRQQYPLQVAPKGKRCGGRVWEREGRSTSEAFLLLASLRQVLPHGHEKRIWNFRVMEQQNFSLDCKNQESLRSPRQALPRA